MGSDANRERMSVERPEAEDEPDDEQPADGADATASVETETEERADLRCGIDLGIDDG